MGHGGDQLMCSRARQHRVAVEGDHVFHLAQLRLCAAFHPGERLTFAAQPAVQRIQLAAFALISHPHALRRIHFTVAMQQRK